MESPAFLKLKQNNKIVKNPLLASFKNDKLAFFSSFLMAWQTGVYLYTLAFFVPYFFKTHYPDASGIVSNLNLLNLLCISACILFSGVLTDKFQRRPLMMFGSLTFAMMAYFQFSRDIASHMEQFLLFNILLCILASLFWGGMNTLIIEAFHARSRFSGASSVIVWVLRYLVERRPCSVCI